MENVRELARRLFRKVYEYGEYYIFLTPPLHALPPERPLPEGLRIVRIDRDTAAEMEQWEGLPANKRRDFRRMLAQGQFGYFALDGTRVAGHLWAIVNRGPGVINRGYVRIYPGEVYFHYAHTYPPYRRQGIAYDLALRLMHDVMAMPGIKTGKASVLSHNTPSLTMVQALGAQRVGRILYWRILGIPHRKVLLEPGTEQQGVRW